MRSSDAPFMPEPRFVWPENQRCAAMLCFDHSTLQPA